MPGSSDSSDHASAVPARIMAPPTASSISSAICRVHVTSEAMVDEFTEGKSGVKLERKEKKKIPKTQTASPAPFDPQPPPGVHLLIEKHPRIRDRSNLHVVIEPFFFIGAAQCEAQMEIRFLVIAVLACLSVASAQWRVGVVPADQCAAAANATFKLDAATGALQLASGGCLWRTSDDNTVVFVPPAQCGTAPGGQWTLEPCTAQKCNSSAMFWVKSALDGKVRSRSPL